MKERTKKGNAARRKGIASMDGEEKEASKGLRWSEGVTDNQ